MAWTAPQTWTANQLVDEGDLNADVRDNMLYLKKKMFSITLLGDTNGVVVTNPNTTYTAMAGTTLANSQARVDWSQLEASIEARIIVTASGNEAGAPKGIAIYEKPGGTELASITWSGTGVQYALASAWTAIDAGILTADRAIEIRVKGASATEDLALYSVIFQVKG